jgi:UDP-GlcNAc:undecaprenyl-phosphate GlcNAc-1-phosphate transferase
MPFLLALGAGVVLMPVARRLGLAAGMVDRPGDPLRIHQEPVPLLGGLAVALAALVGASLAGPSWGTVGGVAVALAVGLVDDRRPLSAWARLAGQAAAGALLAWAGYTLAPLGVAGPLGIVVATVLLTNAVNIVDGQDGLAGGLAAIAALGLASAGGIDATRDGDAMGLALAGALVAFLLWNRPPARIFLGNGGAYAVGVLLLVPAVEVTNRRGWPGLLVATVVLGVFAFELLYTVVRRGRSRVPVMAGDRAHSYDAVARAVGTRARSTLLFWGLGAVAAGVGVLVDASL